MPKRTLSDAVIEAVWLIGKDTLKAVQGMDSKDSERALTVAHYTTVLMTNSRVFAATHKREPTLEELIAFSKGRDEHWRIAGRIYDELIRKAMPP